MSEIEPIEHAEPAPAPAPAAIDRAALDGEFRDLLARLRRGDGDQGTAARIAELNRLLHGTPRP